MDTEFLSKINSSEYGIWYGMIKRCHDHNNQAYGNYGGRGIFVCDRWLGNDGFDNFYSDMGPRPSKEHSLDRIDNNAGYKPDNCRWATKKQQARNRRSTKLLTVGEETKSMVEWSEISGIDRKTIADRLRDGWCPKDAIFSKVRPASTVEIGTVYNKWTVTQIASKAKNSQARCHCRCECGSVAMVTIQDLKSGKTKQCKSCSGITNFSKRSVLNLTVNGITKSLMDWAREYGIHNTTIRQRLKYGWSQEEAVLGKLSPKTFPE